MRHLLLFAHIFGFVLWMGGGLTAMIVGITMRSVPRPELPVLVGLQGKLHSRLILPGILLVVASGLVLTLRLYGGAMSVDGFPVPLMVMQGAGLLAAIVALVVTLPTISRLGRLDPTGEQAPLFTALHNKAAFSGSLTGILAITALVSGVLLR